MYGVLLAFFVVVFNLMMEWLAIAIDAPLLMIALFSYPFLIHKHHQKFDAEHALFKLGDLGSQFYTKFIQLFHTKKGVILGVVGMLVLHLLTDVGNYLIPYIFGIHDALYFAQLGLDSHQSLVSLLHSSLSGYDLLFSKVSVIGIYIFNIIAYLFFLIFPSYMWYVLFKKKQMSEDTFSSFVVGLFFSSMVGFFLASLLRITQLRDSSLLGVDIQTRSLESVSLITSVEAIFLLCVALFCFVFLLCHKKSVKKVFMVFPLSISIIFFGIYIWNYFLSSLYYYLGVASSFFIESKYLIGSFFYIFLGINALFYLGGFFAFLYMAIIEEEEVIDSGSNEA